MIELPRNSIRWCRNKTQEHSAKWAGLFAITPTPLLAEVCDNARPSWSPADGPVSTLGEAWFLLLSPLGLIVLAVLGLGLLSRSGKWLAIATVTLGGFGALLATRDRIEDPSGITQLARIEGCMGPTDLAVAISFGFCLICAGLWVFARKPE